MLCPKCRLDMQLMSREEDGKNERKIYKCRNKQCPERGKEIQREIRK